MPHEIRQVPAEELNSAREELKKTHYPIAPGTTYGSGIHSRSSQNLLEVAGRFFPDAVLELQAASRKGHPMKKEYFVDRTKAKPLLHLTDGELSVMAELRPRPLPRKKFLALLGKHGVRPRKPGGRYLSNYLSRLNSSLNEAAGWSWTITSIRSQSGKIHYAVSRDAGDHFGFQPPTDLRHMYSRARSRLISYFDSHDKATSLELDRQVGYGRRGFTTPAARIRRDVLDVNAAYQALLGYPLFNITRLGKGGVNSPLLFSVNPVARGVAAQPSGQAQPPSTPTELGYGRPGEALDILLRELSVSKTQLAAKLGCAPSTAGDHLAALNSMQVAGVSPPHVLSGATQKKLGQRHVPTPAILRAFGRPVPHDLVYLLLTERAREHYRRILKERLKPEDFAHYSPRTSSNLRDAVCEVERARGIVRAAKAAERSARKHAKKQGEPTAQAARKGYLDGIDAILNGQDDLFSHERK